MSANVQDARPTINIDDSDNRSLTQSLLDLQVSEDVTGLYRCEAMFGNEGLVDGGRFQPEPCRQGGRRRRSGELGPPLHEHRGGGVA